MVIKKTRLYGCIASFAKNEFIIRYYVRIVIRLKFPKMEDVIIETPKELLTDHL